MGFMDQFSSAFNATQQTRKPQPVNMPAPQPIQEDPPVVPTYDYQVGPIPQLPPRAPQPMEFGNPFKYDEEVTVGPANDDEQLYEEFKQNVLNPPKRTQMTYPPNILAGLTKALDVARTPTDYEKNRVFVGGNAYQKAKVFTDTEGKQHFVEPYKQPGFMENVMQAMPEATSVAPAILNQKRQDELADWDLKNKGLTAAINAGSAQALGRQRQAQADWLTQKPDIERDKVMIQRLTAQERVRVSQLKTLTDAQLEAERQAGRISLAEYNATQAMKRVEAQQAGATQRTGMTIEGNKALETIRQRGRVELEDLRSLNDEELENLKQDNRLDLESRRQINREINIRTRAAESRTTKAAPGSSTNSAGQYPTQQKQAAINKANEVLNANPQWKDLITFDPQTGMPRLEQPSDPWFGEPDFTEYDKAYEALYGRKRGNAPTAPAGSTTPPNAPTAPTATTPSSTTTIPPKASSNTTGSTPKVNPPGGIKFDTNANKNGPDTESVRRRTQENARIQKSASDYLKQNGKPITPANIEWVIKQGMVK